jgi:tetratricopeptide (TPR) repeat protein
VQPEYPKIDGPIEGRNKPLKDVDSTARTQLLKALAWLVPPLLALGLLAVSAAARAGFTPLQALLVGFGVGAGGAAFFFIVIYRGVIGGTASLLGRIYGVGSSGTPSPPTYWRARALSARGAHADALKALEVAAREDPRDPAPCLRAAALCLEELGDPQAAADWYRRARQAAAGDAATDAYVSLRLAELFERQGESAKAMVELRRLVTLYPESQYASLARKRLAELKAHQAESEAKEREPEG